LSGLLQRPLNAKLQQSLAGLTQPNGRCHWRLSLLPSKVSPTLVWG
jgi:hypothetical protein